MESILHLLWILFLVYSAMAAFLVAFVRLVTLRPFSGQFNEDALTIGEIFDADPAAHHFKE
jgi:hypothetical protein